MTTPTEWNPRFAAYASAHGRTPEEQHEAEPLNCGFILWMGAKWNDFNREHSIADHSAQSCAANRDGTFDAWLHQNPQETE